MGSFSPDRRNECLCFGVFTFALKVLILNLLCLASALLARTQAVFVQNKGQWPDPVVARAGVPSGALWVEKNAFLWNFHEAEFESFLHPGPNRPPEDYVFRSHAFRVSFEGSAPDASTSMESLLPQYYNYYLGDDSTHWAGHAAASGRVHYHGLYPGIDLHLYGRGNSLKYDFVVRPGADPADIRMAYDGGEGFSVSRWGDALRLQSTVNTIIEQRPYAYQVVGTRLVEVPCEFVLKDGKVGFRTGPYNKDIDLVIDPELVFATFIGATASNFGFTACNDSQDRLISGAAVFAAGYPTSPGAFETDFNTAVTNYMDIALSKFSADGNQLLYSTYIGGGKQETGHSVIADGDDNFLLFGVTGSNDFPTTSGAFQEAFAGGPILMMGDFFISGHPDGTDLFIAKFLEDGTLDASTFVGGNNNEGLNYADKLFYNYGDAFRGEINVDDENDIFVATVCNGTFPVTPDAFQGTYGGGTCDGLLFKMSSDLSSLVFSSYVGGLGDDACYAIDFADDGDLLIAGGTRSSNFPHAGNGADESYNGDVDGFVMRISSTGFNVENGTFAGTSSYDQVYFLQTDNNGFVYVLGQTEGTMAITPGCYGQPNSGQFIQKLGPALDTVEWTTTIGTGSGEIDISPTAFLVSDCEQIYFSGWGGQTNGYCGLAYTCYASASTTNGLPLTPDANQPDTDGSDFYLCVLAPDATGLTYGSFLGGPVSNEHVDGGTSRFDKDGQVYQAVCAGCGGSSDFPTTPGAWSSENPSNNCNIAVFKFNLGGVFASLQIDGPPQVCEGTPAPLVNLSTGATDYLWTFGDGQSSTAFQPSHVYEAPGNYLVTLIATDSSGCLAPDTATIAIEVLPGVNPQVDPVDPVCQGESAQLSASGSDNLYWIDDFTLSDPTIPNPTVSPDMSQFYCVVDSNDCEIDTACVWVELFIPDTAVSPDAEICVGGSVNLFATGGVSVEWWPATGLDDAFSPFVTASPVETTIYTVTIYTEYGCEVSEEVTVEVYENPPGGNVYPDLNMCAGNNVLVTASDGSSWSWDPAEWAEQPNQQQTMVFPPDTTTFVITIVNPCGSGEDEVTVNVIVPQALATGGGDICVGDSIAAVASGGVEYFWSPPSFAHPFDEASTQLSPFEDMTFTVIVTDQHGCADEAEVFVNVLPQPYVDAGPDQHVDFPDAASLYGTAEGETFYWSPPLYIDCTGCLGPVVNPPQSMYYYLTAGGENGCTATDSVWVDIYFPLWVPNTITPNHDGINDYFRAYGENIRGFHLWIIDRWGIEIFESQNMEEMWDGGINGYYVQNDTYVWIIEYETVERTVRIRGHVNVLR